MASIAAATWKTLCKTSKNMSGRLMKGRDDRLGKVAVSSAIFIIKRQLEWAQAAKGFNVGINHQSDPP